jgi:hypothetical protein
LTGPGTQPDEQLSGRAFFVRIDRLHQRLFPEKIGNHGQEGPPRDGASRVKVGKTASGWAEKRMSEEKKRTGQPEKKAPPGTIEGISGPCVTEHDSLRVAMAPALHENDGIGPAPALNFGRFMPPVDRQRTMQTRRTAFFLYKAGFLDTIL